MADKEETIDPNINLEIEKLFREKREAAQKAPFNMGRFVRQMESYTPITEILENELKKKRLAQKPKRHVSFSSTVSMVEYDV